MKMTPIPGLPKTDLSFPIYFHDRNLLFRTKIKQSSQARTTTHDDHSIPRVKKDRTGKTEFSASAHAMQRNDNHGSGMEAFQFTHRFADPWRILRDHRFF